MSSIRRTLVLLLLGSVALVVVLNGVAAWRLSHEQSDALFDYQLEQLSLSLRDQAFVHALQPDLREDRFDFVVQVWDASGVRLYLSHPHRPLPASVQLGFSTVQTPEGRWRVYGEVVRGQVIAVAQPMAVRERMAVAAATRAVAPSLLVLPLMALAVWWAVGRGLAPVERFAVDVAERSATDLRPIPETAVPVEVRPLMGALNDLLARLDAAITGQRAFVADAAHELRTPIAALKLQAQLVARAGDDAGRAAALADLQAGIDRITHLVGQLLTLARQEPGAPVRLQPVDLAELAREAMAAQAVIAEDAGVALEACGEPEHLPMQGDPEGLRAAVSNILSNALRYTPRGGHVRVAWGVAGECPFVEVADDGPGIEPAERERVFDRFYRGAAVDRPGSGLGLAIVRAVAERHGGQVRLGDAPGGGLQVRLELGQGGRR